MVHWSSRDIVQTLFYRNENLLLDTFDLKFTSVAFKKSRRIDSNLGGLLSDKTGDEAVDMLKRLCPHPELIPNISKLTTAFTLIQAVPEEQRTPGTGWYNRATCYEFHKLLVSSLIAYANALRILFRVRTQLDGKRKAKITPAVQSTIDGLEGMLPDCAEQLLRCIHLVWIITDSHILCHHVKLLHAGHYLHQPSKGAGGQTKVFGLITPEWTLKVIDPLDDGKAYDEAGQDGVWDDDKDQSEEFRFMKDTRNLDKSFLNWMQFQMSHRIGQETLTSSRTPSKSILSRLEISLAIVEHPSDINSTMDPSEMKLVLGSLHFPAGFDVQAAINTIQDQVQKQTISRSDSRILSTVRLPTWLPLEQTVIRYKAILRDEIIKMMAPKTDPDASQ